MVGGPPTLQTMSVTRLAQRNDFQYLNKHTSSVSTAAAALRFENPWQNHVLLNVIALELSLFFRCVLIGVAIETSVIMCVFFDPAIFALCCQRVQWLKSKNH